MNDFNPGLIDSILELLPVSPFRQFLADFADLPFLPQLNWFIPVRGILIVTAAWLGSIALFYIYQTIMRWLKLIN